MPIFRLPTGLGYFADVPGCGGGAVIRNLEARFGALAFYDPAHTEAPRVNRWSRTSPQHVGRSTLKRLFPADFFVCSFALVRHPVHRLLAVYAFQRDVEGAIPQATDFSEWLEDIAERMEEEPWVFDNAVRPMVDLVPEGAEVFRLEDGTAAVDAWLDQAGEAPGPALKPAADAGTDLAVSPLDLDRIAELYGPDFRRFGYDGEPGEIAGPMRRPAGRGLFGRVRA